MIFSVTIPAKQKGDAQRISFNFYSTELYFSLVQIEGHFDIHFNRDRTSIFL